MKKLVMIGCGGHAMSVLDSLDMSQYQLVGFIDEYLKESKREEYPILAHSISQLKNKEQYCYFVAIGDNAIRRKLLEELDSYQLEIINVIDSSALISKHCSLGKGCFVGKMAIINTDVSVGDGVIVNTRALIEHGSIISDYVNISTSTTINGDVMVGCESFIGSGAVVNNQIHIGKKSIVGSGSVVIRDVSDSITVVGVPAKKIS